MASLNFSLDSDSNNMMKHLIDRINYSYFPGHVLVFLYELSSCIWIFYVIRKLHFHLREKRVLEAKRSSGALLDAVELDRKILSVKLTLFRFWLFSIFLTVEILFALNLWLYGIFVNNLTPARVNIGHNFTLQPNSFLAQWYDLEAGYFVINLMIVVQRFSIALIIWLFGASLLNLSHAALDRIQVKKVIKYILIGIFINLVLAVGTIVPYTSIFFTLIQSLMDQLSLFIVMYIAKKKFFPAMKLHVRFSLQNAFSINEIRKQGRLLKLYKYVIAFFMITFEINILNKLIFYNGLIIIESISANPCWLTVTYQFPVFKLSDWTITILSHIGLCFLIAVRLIGTIVYFNLIIMNATIICITSWPILKQLFTKRLVAYRFRIVQDESSES